MNCPSCGKDNLADAKFCDGCGSKLEAPPPASAEPKKRFCSACGAQIKPAAKFCGSCGAAVGAPGSGAQPAPAPRAPAPVPQAPAPAPAPAPQPAAPTPAPQPAAPAPAPPPSVARPRGASQPPPKAAGNKGCRVGCVLLLVLLAAIVGGGYYVWNNVILSNPAALTGDWEIKEGDTAMGSDKFGFEPVEGGAKLVGPGAKEIPVEVVFKPEGGRTFKARAENPTDRNQWLELTIELQNFTTMKLKAETSAGTLDEAEATRVLDAGK